MPAKTNSYKKILFLIVLPSLLVAFSMLVLYLYILPTFPVVKVYYFPQSTDIYATYRTAILGHIIFGAIALILGPINLFNALRGRHFKVHRWVGSTYAVAVSISAVCAMFMSFYAYPGTMPFGRLLVTSGFFTLGLVWLVTLYLALYNILVKRNKRRHMFWMIINVSLIFAAVVIRVENSLLVALDLFEAYYPLLGWVSWLPNLLVGYLLAKKLQVKI